MDDGIDSFYKDLGINAEENLVVLLISQYMNAKNMGEYHFHEFKEGCESLGCDNIKKFKVCIEKQLNNEVK